ncbi:hypothetical protein [Bacillus tuaregi]|uniref:hypothetical protein n=1 Tax=Bacillus tuaregi TaxID=1816695 RepID=UPI0008F889E6|nr:hypothetical protein [Bacillus tuaregi]
MTFSIMLRLFGLSSIIGGGAVALVQVWFYFDQDSFIATYFNQVGYSLMAFGILGLYLSQYKSFGGLGLFSFIFLSLGTFLWLGYKWFETFVVADIKQSAPELMESGLHTTVFGVNLSLYTVLVGLLLFAVISFWKGVHTRWGLALLVLAVIAVLAPFGLWISQALAGIAFLLLGISLWRGNNEDVTRTKLNAQAGWD